MSATNSTANYGLPIFVSSDVPSWLTDWNGAMGDIDTAIAAAKAVADSALLASGNNTSDITTIQGQITSLQNTVGTHTTQIGTISGNINTINSLIGNGTPTTTDQTLIGAINELHANQGDLTNLTTTDKTSLVAAINEVAQGGGGAPAASAVSYDNTGSGLSASNVQDAIDELAGSDVGSVSITTGANVSWTQALTQLEAAADLSKITHNSKIVVDDGTSYGVFALAQKTNSLLEYFRCNGSGATNSYIDVLDVKGHTFYNSTISSTCSRSDVSSQTTYTSNATITMYY